MHSQHALYSADRREQLLSRYRKASPDVQLTLRLISVVYEPVTQTHIGKMLQVLHTAQPEWLSSAPGFNKAFKETLIEQELLQSQQARVQCHPAIIEVLTREAVSREEWQAMVAAAAKVEPVRLLSGYRTRIEAVVRALRIRLYNGDPEGVSECLQQLQAHPQAYRVFAERHPLVQICSNPLDPEWLMTLPDSIGLFVVSELLEASNLNLVSDQGALAMLEQYVERNDDPGWMNSLFEQRFMRGQLQGLENFLNTEASGEALDRLVRKRLVASYQCACGDYDAAAAGFADVLSEIRRNTRKRNVYIGGLPGIFYVLALMAQSRNPAQLALARTQTAMAIKLKQDHYLSVYTLLDSCIDVLQGQSRPEQQPLLNAAYPADADPFFVLFRALILTWLGQPVDDETLQRLSEHSAQALKAHILWFASTYAGLLQRLKRQANKAQGKAAAVASAQSESKSSERPFYALAELIQPESDWERVLRTLQNMSRTGDASGDRTADADQDRRMVWFLHGTGSELRLEPREQKITKNGRWSKGRVIALKRLYREAESFDYMQAEDRDICQTIERYTETDYYGYYGHDAFELGSNSLWAAVGHPKVFWADNQKQPVELLKGEPQLQVSKQKNGLKLAFIPALNGSDELLIERESPYRLRLFRITEPQARVANLLGKKGLQVPDSARQQVMDSIGAIAPLMTVHSEIGGGADIQTVPANSTPHIHIQPLGDGLQLEIFVQPFATEGPLMKPGHGGLMVLGDIDGQQVQAERDLQQEKARLEQVYQQCPLLSGHDQTVCELTEPERALETLFQLQQLDDDAVVLEWPQGKAVRLGREVTMQQVQLSVRQQQNWFEVEGNVALDDEQTLDMYRLMELLTQAEGRFIKLDNGEFLALTEALRQRLEAMQAFARRQGQQLLVHPLAASAVDELTEGMQVKSGKHWKNQLQRIEDAQNQVMEVPSTLQAELRDYQCEGFRWLARLAHWGAGACLADDMGLGKTIQALALMLTRAADGPSLVVAPTSVCMNWLDETRRFAPTLNGQLFGAGDRAQMIETAGSFDLIVCSYGLLQHSVELFAGRSWHTIVIDEAQAIKNAQTKRSKAIMRLQGDFRMITTGTPIENHLGELWNLFQFINPGLLGSLEQFNQRFALPIEQNNDPAARQNLKKLVQPFLLRRLKSTVLSELPPRTETTLQVTLSQEEAALIEALRRQALEHLQQAETDDSDGQKRLRILAEIMRLRRACCNPKLVMPETDIGSSKLQVFSELVEELLANQHKALVFSQFVDHLTLLRQWLDEQGIHYQYLDGSTAQKQRKQAVDAFQAGQGDLFLISLRAGGAGLNLTAADYVIHMDPWWNPAVEDQASDRAHRMGQQRPVTIYRLIAQGTIEEKIVRLHQHKRDLADSLLEGSEMSARMSVEDMMALIQAV